MWIASFEPAATDKASLRSTLRRRTRLQQRLVVEIGDGTPKTERRYRQFSTASLVDRRFPAGLGPDIHRHLHPILGDDQGRLAIFVGAVEIALHVDLPAVRARNGDVVRF